MWLEHGWVLSWIWILHFLLKRNYPFHSKENNWKSRCWNFRNHCSISNYNYIYNSNNISITKIHESFEKLSLKQSNDNIPKQLTTTLNVHSKKNMVTNLKRQNNISSNSKNSKNKNVSVIIGDSIIKDIKGWELSNESEKFIIKFSGVATTKDMES